MIDFLRTSELFRYEIIIVLWLVVMVDFLGTSKIFRFGIVTVSRVVLFLQKWIVCYVLLVYDPGHYSQM